VVELFADFLDIVNEKGHIDEEQYDIRGIRMDKDINGQDVFRTVKDAEDDTVRNRIRLAFDCRTMQNQIEGTLPFDLSGEADQNEDKNYSFHKITLTDNRGMTSILRQARRRSLPVTSISCILQKKERAKRKETS